MSKLPKHPKDTKLVLPARRPKGLPDMYIMAKPHPKRGNGTGRTLYYIQDTSRAGMTAALQTEVNTPVVDGTEQMAITKGYVKLQEDDHVFSRPLKGRVSGEDDVLVVAVFSPDILSNDVKNELLRVRDLVLGPIDQRDLHSDKGTAFERTHPTKVLDGRCYAFGNSYEVPKCLTAPCADGRSTKDTEVLEMRTALLNITAKVALTNMRYAPSEILEHLQLNADVLNLPSIGADGNVAFTSNQLNIVGVECKGKSRRVKEDLGHFGEKHRDEGDAPGAFTHVTSVGDMGAKDDTGRFFIAYPGIFIPMKQCVSFIFSGLRQHGATSAVVQARTPEREIKRRGRLSLVSYAKNGSMNPRQRFALAAIPGSKDQQSELFNVPPEFATESNNAIESCTHSTFAKDGHVVMDRKNLTEFMARNLLNVSLGFLRQLDPSIGARINSDQFLGAFSFLDADNSGYRSVPPWMSGPGWRPAPSNTTDMQDIAMPDLVAQQVAVLPEARKRLDTFVNEYSKHVPWLSADKNSVQFPPESKKKTNQKSSKRKKGGNGRRKPKGKHSRGCDEEDAEGPETIQTGTKRKRPALRQKEGAEGPESEEGVDFPTPKRQNTSTAEATYIAYTNPPPFLKKLTPEYIAGYISTTQEDLLSLESTVQRTGATQDLASERSALNIHTHLTDRPFEVSTLSTVRTTWDAVGTLTTNACQAEVWIRYVRTLIMKTTRDMWLWIESVIPHLIGKIIEKAPHAAVPWLETLVHQVSEVIIHKTPCAMVECPPDIDPGDITVSVPAYNNDSTITENITAATCSVIRQWLRYPSPDVGRVQACFIHALLRDTDEYVLFLPHVWETFKAATRTACQGILGTIDWSNERIMDGWPDHPLYNHRSPERVGLRNIGILSTLFAQREDDPKFDMARDVCRPIVLARQNMFQTFLMDAYKVIFWKETIADTRRQKLFTTEGDAYNPFREEAPTRMRMKGADGPFTQDGGNRKSAIFSAMVCRGITFNTEFSRTGPMYFSSFNDFQRACADMDQTDPAFFCNTRAYGTVEPQRRIELAEVYWTSLEKHWAEVPVDTWDPMDALRFFRASDKTARKKGATKRFPQLGDLSSYLLVCDLIYGSMVNMFTPTQMAKNVRDINKGAVKGLEMLKLVPARISKGGKLPVEQCQAGLSKAMGLAKAVLPADAEFDDITLEHALCKLSKIPM